MDDFIKRLEVYIKSQKFDGGDSGWDTILDLLYQAYIESHEKDPMEISEGFKELDVLLGSLPLEDNNTVFNLCCRLCSAYERRAFIDGLQYGAHLIRELDLS